MGFTIGDVVGNVDLLIPTWRDQRADRQARRHLERADFDQLRDAGLLALIAPSTAAGCGSRCRLGADDCVTSTAGSGAVDSSVALVSSMHPAVISFWLATPDSAQPAWEEQRAAVFASAVAGEQWGTITSEPGSGGDIARTKSVAEPSDGETFLPGDAYAVTGDKHFGSGLGITDRMVTIGDPGGRGRSDDLRARRP